MDYAWGGTNGTDNGWLDALSYTTVAVGQWPGRGEGSNIKPYCGLNTNPSSFASNGSSGSNSGNMGSYKINLGAIPQVDCLNDLILVRIRMTGSGTITNISITQ